MDKKDSLVLAGICIGGCFAVTLVVLAASGVIKNPFL
jgi:poly(3-hydroxyalkanoate) synthetase